MKNRPISELELATSVNDEDILLISQKENNQYVSRKIGAGVFRGASAYELAVDNGFNGTLNDWLASIKGWQPSTSEEYMNLLNSTLKDSPLYTNLTSKVELMDIRFHDELRDSVAAMQAHRIELLEKHDTAVASIKKTQQELVDEVNTRVEDAFKAKQLLEAEVEERKFAVLEVIDAIQQERATRVQELTLLNNKIVTEAKDKLDSILNLGTQLEQESAERVREVEAIYAQLKLDQENYAKELSSLNDDITTEAKTRLDELLRLNNITKAIDEKVIGVFAKVNPEYVGKDSGSIGDTVKKVGVWTEYSARIEGDVAIGSRIDNLVSQVDDNSAVISQVNKTIVDSNQSLASQITAIKAEYNDNTAKVTKDIETLVNSDEATAKLLEGIESNFKDYKADIVKTYITTADANSALTQGLETFKVEQLIPTVNGETGKLASTYDKLLETEVKDGVTTSKRLDGLESNYTDLSGKAVTAEALDSFITSAKADEAITNVISKYKTEIIDPILGTKVSSETIKDYYNKSTTDEVINDALVEYKTSYVDPQLNL